MEPGNRDLLANARNFVDDFVISKYTRNMPLRLIDTYSGLMLERSDIVSLLKMRRDYRAKLEAAIQEIEHIGTLIDRECPPQRPNLDHLDSFIAEYLAYAMFSHSWRGQEPTFNDVRKATHGIYSMDDNLLEEGPKVFHFPKNMDSDLPSGVQKLQEFCCLAAKCGFRWAWSDTCCINKKDYGEMSESINCMFLWYRCSDLTIVYLDDVDDVKEGRLPAVDDEDGNRWFEDREIKEPFPHSYPSAAPTPSDIYVMTLQTEPYLSLHDRLRNGNHPQLRSMKPDSQVEAPHFIAHLMDNFPDVEDRIRMGKFRELPIWVTRGWTLQEMIASKRLRFYSKRWTLLEETNDPDTDEEEEMFSISSFRYRARLLDHRRNDIWNAALVRTTGLLRDDLVNFKVGTRDVRTRLLWAAKRTTTKVEDMVYCLLGIFDISLPPVYGEGPRAFFRLQEELMKRTGDLSLFDWCGTSSSVNTFLASSPKCFIEANHPVPDLDDSTDSIFRMIVDVFRLIFGTVWSGIKAAVHKAKDWIKNIIKSPPPGHTLVNGKLNLSLFEHQVKSCEPLGNSSSGDPYYHYKLEIDGLVPTTVTVASPASGLIINPTQYYVCRAWDRHAENVFHMFLELIEYILKDIWQGVWNSDDSESEYPEPVVNDEDDHPESKLRAEMQMKRKKVLKFFKCPFPVYLVHVQDGHGVRVSTVKRVASVYSKFDFTMPVVTRLFL